MENQENKSINRPKTAPLAVQINCTPSKSKFQGATTKTPSIRLLTSPKTPSIPFVLSTTKRIDSATSIKRAIESAQKEKVSELKLKWALEKEKKKKPNETYSTTTENKTESGSQSMSPSDWAADKLALERMQKQRKRQSVLLNKQIREQARQREAMLEAQQRENEKSVLESRRLASSDVQEAKRAEAMRKRQSMIGRGAAAKVVKEKVVELRQKAKEEEVALIEFRRRLWADRQEQRREEAEAGRVIAVENIKHWKHIKEVEGRDEHQLEEQRKIDYEVRRADWQAMQQYQATIQKSRRGSISARLDEWRHQRTEAEVRISEQQLQEAVEAELAQQEAEDVRVHQEKLKAQRRESLAWRLNKARQEKSADEMREIAAAAIREEEKRLAEEDRKRVAAYQQSLADAERQSIEYRNQAEMQERLRLEGEAELAKLRETAEREQRDEDWRRVREYQAAQQAERRRSVAARLVETHRHHELALEEHRQKLDLIHRDLELRRQDWVAVNEAKEDSKKRSRMSMALRLDSWRNQRVCEEMLQAKKLIEAADEARTRADDWKALQEAKEALLLEMRERESALPRMLF